MNHRLRRDCIEPTVSEILNRAAARPDASSLIVAKKEQFVLNDRSAYRSAELVLLKWTARATRFVILPAIRIELIVLKNFEQHAMDFIRARLQIHVDDTPRSAPILRVVA